MGVKVTLGFPGGSVVKNPPASVGDAGDLGSSLGGEDLLEEEMATHSSILAWGIPRTEEPGRLQSMGSQSRTQLGNRTTHSRGALQRLRVGTGEVLTVCAGWRWRLLTHFHSECPLWVCPFEIACLGLFLLLGRGARKRTQEERAFTAVSQKGVL